MLGQIIISNLCLVESLRMNEIETKKQNIIYDL
jgi:hypothetical protein